MSHVMNNQLDPETQSNVDRWLNENYDADTKSEIRNMINSHPQEITDAFYKNLTFGTGGLRGIMGVGCNRINSYTVRAATQGLADYLNLQSLPPQSFHTVLIGYDSRHNSRAFAEETAKVLAANKIHVLLFRNMSPVPLISFGCRYKKCSAAVIITASHNPPQYNGYKIYWSDGAQVLAPHENSIIKRINQITDLDMIKTISSLNDPLIEEIDGEIDKAYLDSVTRLQNYYDDNNLKGPELKVVYTSLHGTGITLMPEILTRWGFTNIHLVDQQIAPDGDFPTVPSPNPEDPKTLALGIQKLMEVNGDLLIATDPDADRIGAAILHDKKIKIFSGNQIAALLLNHICNALSAKNKIPANGAFIKTIVTTELFQAIADYYQKPCFNVFPGFKYVAEKIRQWEKEPRGNQFIFGSEESNGYLYGTQTRDKDAISIGALICEMALQAKLRGKTLLDLLHELYRHYGVYEEVISTIKFEESKAGKEQMAKCMRLLRRAPPVAIAETKVVFFEDFEQSIRVEFKTHKIEPLQQPKSDILLFWLEDGSKIIVRPSGTEPKIKIYIGIVEKPQDNIEEALKKCESKANAFTLALKEILLEER